MQNNTDNRPEIDVVCGVITDGEGRYLVCRRPEGKHLGGLWEFPGGKVDAGELPESALVRELEEELEIRVAVEDSLTPVRWEYDSVTVLLMPFLCKILSGNPRPVEHSEVRWSPSHAFTELDWAPADRPILDELMLKDFAPVK